MTDRRVDWNDEKDDVDVEDSLELPASQSVRAEKYVGGFERSVSKTYSAATVRTSSIYRPLWKRNKFDGRLT